MKVSKIALMTSLGAVLFSTYAIAQEEAKQEDTVVVTGTRVAARSALNTPAAVDVISAAQINSGGTTEINQALSTALPSFNFPRPSLADGSDAIRPATLRGLAPDQTLVLVNSKRRHAASLVNLNGTIGRGSAAVDLNTLPTGIIKSIEVLRDGASAQYGSDAIAGVINIRLKEASSGGGVNVSVGQYNTRVKTNVDVPRTLSGAVAVNPNWSVANLANYDRHDGQKVNVSAWVGLPIKQKGFITIALDVLNQEHTMRTAPDWRQQYALVGASFDPREATINRYNAWYGEPEITQTTLFANAGYSYSDNVETYAWLSVQDRISKSPGFFRRSGDSRNVVEIYPDGFLPFIVPKVLDLSSAVGTKWKWGNWDMDLSLVNGYNRMEFTIKNTLNRSYGTASRTQFDAGGFDYQQNVLDLSGVRQYDVGLASPLNVAAGVSYRHEEYSIFAGEVQSYANGGVLLGGSPTPSGAQVFPGFKPQNEVSPKRDSYAAYVDLEANLSEAFLVGGAVRYEHYQGFGDVVTGKISGRYDFTPNFALRGSIQNGFRAPALQQIGFTSTATNFISGVPFEITTFTPNDPVAKALGAQPLEPEKSTNYALGAVVRGGGFSVTIDAYQIEIENRIVLSENLTQAAVRNYLTAQGFVGIGGGRFFINGVDTTTKGVDIVANYTLRTDNAGKYAFTLGANFNDNKVNKVPNRPILNTLGLASDVLFQRVNTLTFEKGQPESKFSGSVDWSMGNLGASIKATRYGESLAPGAAANADLVLDAKTIIDLSANYRLNSHTKFTVGADNVTDEYPTQNNGAPNSAGVSLNSTSNTPFSNLAPFGRSGRYIYGKVSFEW